jgi:hypothetical protein
MPPASFAVTRRIPYARRVADVNAAALIDAGRPPS